MNKLYIGTENGLMLLSEQADGWHRDGVLLEHLEVNGVVKSGEDGTLLVATRQGGLFRVDPRTGICEPVAAHMLPKALRCITKSPHDPLCILVGCEPTAIYKSVDGGRNWKECRGVAAIADARHWKYPVPTIPPHIRHIIVDSADPRRIYAAGQVGGVLRSEDGGETWRDVVDGLDPDVHTLAQDPSHPEVLYAAAGGGGFPDDPGGYPPSPPQGYPLYRSDDRGVSWHSISTTFTRRYGVPIHLDPRNPSTVIAAAAAGIPTDWLRPEGADAVLLVSRDRGETWKQLVNGLPKSFPNMVEVIETDPSADGRFFVGIGGEGTKMLPPEYRKGAVYYADQLDGPWSRVPFDFPVVYTLTAA